MKKNASLIVSLLFISTLVSCGSPSVSATSSSSEAPNTMTSKMADMYLMNGTKYDQMRLYFFSGVNDVPYIDTDTLSSDLQFLGKQIFGTDYKLSVSSKDEVFTFRRENGSSFTFDFKNRSLTYDNIDDLFSHSYYETSVDTLNATGFDDDNQPAYYEREKGLVLKGMAINTRMSIWVMTTSRCIFKTGKAICLSRPIQIFSSVLF